MKNWIIVFIGGGVGSLCRYLLGKWINETFETPFPWGTFTINIIGCLLIGFFVFYFSEARFGGESVAWRLLLVTGLCGGFTTFSAFSFENVQLIQTKQAPIFLAYTFASLALGFLATYAGILVAKNI